MRKTNIFVIAILCFLLLPCILPSTTSRTTISAMKTDNKFGSVTLHEDGCYDGYTLLSVMSFSSISLRSRYISTEEWYALLVDMNGNVIKRWSCLPDPAKMLPGGSILTASGKVYNLLDETNVSQLDWNGNIEWNFVGWDDDGTGKLMARVHHDYQREGNPVGYYAPGQDFVSFGKTLILGHVTAHNTSISRKAFFDDVIYEVNWDGTSSGFEWHASDHINEMGFDSKARIGMWLNPGGSGIPLGCPLGDLFHINSISLLGKNHWYDEDPIKYSCFNPENIIISSRHASFISIISRETGKIVWRVGPDYSKNTEEGRKLGAVIGPHNAHMIPNGLPGAGNILVFDNGGVAGYGLFGFPNLFRSYSRVIEFNPITFEIVNEYHHKKGVNVFPRYGEFHKFYSPTQSSVQRLPNGNTLVTEGLPGRVFELNQDNEIVWEYVTSSRKNLIYRAYRIPPEWVPGNPSNYNFWE